MVDDGKPFNLAVFSEKCLAERRKLRQVLYSAEREICERTGLDVAKLHKFLEDYNKDWKNGLLLTHLIGIKLKYVHITPEHVLIMR